MSTKFMNMDDLNSEFSSLAVGEVNSSNLLEMKFRIYETFPSEFETRKI